MCLRLTVHTYMYKTYWICIGLYEKVKLNYAYVTSDGTRLFSQRLVNDHADACSHVVDQIMYFNIV